MKFNAYIQAIYLAASAGAQMLSINTAKAKAGIETANDWLTAGDEPTFDESETRRNIALAGITASELNALVGQRFQLGSIQLLGTELCTPCERPAQLLGRPSFMEAFEGRGGIRAEVLNSGALAVGDKLFISDEE
jgi:MOSC domain-containing protein YiiM